MNGIVGEVGSQLLELAKAHNQSTNDGASVPATFLRMTSSI
jgi:hypothetical protein